ncbi:Catalase-peroxidase [Dirofilaria immitis]
MSPHIEEREVTKGHGMGVQAKAKYEQKEGEMSELARGWKGKKGTGIEFHEWRCRDPSTIAGPSAIVVVVIVVAIVHC